MLSVIKEEKMHKRIGAILTITSAFLYLSPLQSAPSKVYVKVNAMYGAHDKTSRVRFLSNIAPQAIAGGASFGYKVNRFTVYEVDYIGAGEDSVLRNTLVGVRKELIPLSYSWSIAIHGGLAYKFYNKVKIPFGGIGVHYITSNKIFWELYYRYYRIPDLKWFNPSKHIADQETPRRVHAIVLSVARYFE
jgi:hypothetical protein